VCPIQGYVDVMVTGVVVHHHRQPVVAVLEERHFVDHTTAVDPGVRPIDLLVYGGHIGDSVMGVETSLVLGCVSLVPDTSRINNETVAATVDGVDCHPGWHLFALGVSEFFKVRRNELSEITKRTNKLNRNLFLLSSFKSQILSIFDKKSTGNNLILIRCLVSAMTVCMHATIVNMCYRVFGNAIIKTNVTLSIYEAN